MAEKATCVSYCLKVLLTVIGVTHDHLWLVMDLGLVHEGDAHAPACEWPDQLQKCLSIKLMVFNIDNEIAILVVCNFAFQDIAAC